MEFSLARYVIDHNIPTLGICRGMQILNLVAGGSLIEHIADYQANGIDHRTDDGDLITHEVQIEPNSSLAEYLQCQRCEVASKHHQAILDIAPLFTVSAYAPDGIIEAIESPTHNFLIAVQWHPEMTAATDLTQQRLFAALIAANKNIVK